MFTKVTKVLSLLMIVSLLATLGVGPALAQDLSVAAGDGPGMAVTPSAGVVRIEPGKWQWYLIRSQLPVGAEETKEDGVTFPPAATIDATLRLQSGKVDFEVWSADNLNKWINNTDFDPTGIDTTNESITGNPLFWQGSFLGNNDYYLIVKNRSAQPSFYSLAVTGDVGFPSQLALNTTTPATQEAVAQTQPPVMSTGEMGLTVETPAASAPTQPAMAANMGGGPESALAPTGGVVRIEPGKWQWYSFRAQMSTSVNDSEETTDTTAATINAALRVQSGQVDFAVWSGDNLNNWRNSEDFDPVGAGTKNESLTGTPLFWQGSFENNDLYYLIVMNRGTEPALYSLNVTGDVSFPSAATLPVQ